MFVGKKGVGRVIANAISLLRGKRADEGGGKARNCVLEGKGEVLELLCRQWRVRIRCTMLAYERSGRTTDDYCSWPVYPYLFHTL